MTLQMLAVFLYELFVLFKLDALYKIVLEVSYTVLIIMKMPYFTVFDVKYVVL